LYLRVTWHSCCCLCRGSLVRVSVSVSVARVVVSCCVVMLPPHAPFQAQSATAARLSGGNHHKPSRRTTRSRHAVPSNATGTATGTGTATSSTTTSTAASRLLKKKPSGSRRSAPSSYSSSSSASSSASSAPRSFVTMQKPGQRCDVPVARCHFVCACMRVHVALSPT